MKKTKEAYELTREVSKLKAQLQEKEKIIEKIYFLHSHCIRAPLTTILGLTNLAKYNQQNPSSLYNIILQIKKCADELDRLTSGLE